MPVKPQILVVDDNNINRQILNNILMADYSVSFAENGQQALDYLRVNYKNVAAVLLDIVMPVMDGFEFLRVVSADNFLKTIPIIVSTSNGDRKNEKTALKLGACDFVSKPFDKDLILLRLGSAIEHSQIAAVKKLKYLAEFDLLTGIHNQIKFCETTHQMILDNPDTKYIILRADIYHFHLINSYFGEKIGDDVLKYVANMLKKFAAESDIHMTYGRLEADIFALCMPFSSERSVQQYVRKFNRELKKSGIDFDIFASFGAVIVNNREMPITSMLDRAKLAARQSRGNYLRNCAFYDEAMGQRLDNEQQIINEMSPALANGQFHVYFQPKYDIRTMTPAGAEALVRWVHPQKGIISPGVFIPVFEHNGFIAKLDRFVLESVCKYLRKWLDEDKKPMQISVNMSRVNLNDPKLVKSILHMTKKYNIPTGLISFELTESAYIENSEIMTAVIDELHSNGFSVMMDDFGSGLSSLSVLKDIQVDVLKIDMKFFTNSLISGRGENIIASVVRMSKWLRIPVIAEGVETLKQVEFLREIGCEYVQGFYFARPMPADEYEKRLDEKQNSAFVNHDENAHQFDFEKILSSDNRFGTLFSEMNEAAAVFEYENGKITVIRANNSFYNLFGYGNTVDGFINPFNCIRTAEPNDVNMLFERVIASHKSIQDDLLYEASDKSPMWVHIHLKYINKMSKKGLVYSTFRDVTEQRYIAKELQKYKTAVKSEITKNRVMIIDENESEAEILKSILEVNYSAFIINDKSKAMKILGEDSSICLVLIDVDVDFLGCLDFLNRKKETDASNVPVILITSEKSSGVQTNTISYGANDYIVKPFIEDVVLHRVQSVIESNYRFRRIIREYDNVFEQAHTDSLTGAYNRHALLEFVNHIMKTEKDKKHALIMIDIDRFKLVNDMHGHQYGDELLKELTDKLKSFFANEGIVSRLGGDEFCVFVTDVKSREEMLERCKQLCKNISSTEFEHLNCEISVSVGIAFTESDSDYDGFELLYQKADSALFEAKHKGKNTACVFTNDFFMQ